MKTIDWTCTDPDNEQYGFKVDDGHYVFKERNPFYDEEDEEDIVEMNIILKHYTDEEIEDVARTYYGSLGELKEQCGDSWEWILAECIFEQESGLY